MACLFDSLKVFLKDKHDREPTSQELRDEICDYLLSNNHLMSDIENSDLTLYTSNMNLDDYVREMRKPYTWGSAVEIKTFCEIYKIRVIVVNLIDDRQIEFLPTTKNGIPFVPSCTVYLKYTGNHYTSWKME